MVILSGRVFVDVSVLRSSVMVMCVLRVSVCVDGGLCDGGCGVCMLMCVVVCG